MGLTFHGEKLCSDCPLSNYDFPKWTAWGILLSALIHPDPDDCGKPVHHWRKVFNALSGFKGALAVPTLAEYGLQSEKQHSESDNACKEYAEELLSKLSSQERCRDCKLWWCY